METWTDRECPRCGATKMRSWTELNDDQRFVVERLEGSVDYTAEERRQHRFCTRCWFEDDSRPETVA